MIRRGSVLIFKPEVSTEEAARALRSIAFLLDTPETVSKPNAQTDAQLKEGGSVLYRPSDWADVPFNHSDLVKEYDDEYGGPCWYIP